MFKRALLLASIALLATPVLAEEMTADQVVEKFVEASGGHAAWESVKSVKIGGKMMMGGAFEMPITLFFQRPGKVRMEMEMQGQKNVQAYDGTEGWQIMPLIGKPNAQKMSEDEAKMVKARSDFEGPLFNFQNKGHKIELIGIEDVAGTKAYKLKLTLDTGDEVFSYIDAENFLEFQQVSTVVAPTGEEITAVTKVGDYKAAGDLILAHRREMIPEGAPQGGMVVSFESVELNPAGVDDGLFAMPTAQASPENASENNAGSGSR